MPEHGFRHPIDIKEGGTMPMKRTTHRSVSGTKLYAVRDSKGRFKDIQTYKRAHAADMRHKSKAEKAK
jgi:DNA-binding protein HU-beta